MLEQIQGPLVHLFCNNIGNRVRVQQLMSKHKRREPKEQKAHDGKEGNVLYPRVFEHFGNGGSVANRLVRDTHCYRSVEVAHRVVGWRRLRLPIGELKIGVEDSRHFTRVIVSWDGEKNRG